MLRNSLPTDDERRNVALADASVDITGGEGGDGAAPRTFVGYSSVFNRRTAIGNPLKGGFLEEISPGAFTKTIAEADQRMLLDHDPHYVVARKSAGTLHQAQDAFGLLVRANLDYELSYVKDLAANVRNGNLTGMSIGFRVAPDKDEWTTTTMSTRDGDAEVELRTIREAALIENSAVTFPAYTDTTASLRHSLVPALLQRGDAEAIRRAASYRPDLAPWLGYDPELAPTTINLPIDPKRLVRKVNELPDLPGEVVGQDSTIHADGDVMDPSEERDPKMPYGNVTYADPGYQKDGVKRYPVDTAAHAKSAWSYINKASNAAKYTSEQLARIKGKIKAALKKFGIKTSDDRAFDPADEVTDETYRLRGVEGVPESTNEPAETTRDLDESAAQDDPEPAASTRNAPSQQEMAKARMRVLKTRMRTPA